ncbi:MAG: PEGA domain-containing protein [Acidobacteriota bacterium]
MHLGRVAICMAMLVGCGCVPHVADRGAKRILVRSDPPAASCTVVGYPDVFETPCFLRVYEGERYMVRVEKDGYEPYAFDATTLYGQVGPPRGKAVPGEILVTLNPLPQAYSPPPPPVQEELVPVPLREKPLGEKTLTKKKSKSSGGKKTAPKRSKSPKPKKTVSGMEVNG